MISSIGTFIVLPLDRLPINTPYPIVGIVIVAEGAIREEDYFVIIAGPIAAPIKCQLPSANNFRFSGPISACSIRGGL